MLCVLSGPPQVSVSSVVHIEVEDVGDVGGGVGANLSVLTVVSVLTRVAVASFR